MTPILSHFKTLSRAALVAVALGTAGLAAAPAFAQDDPPTGFTLSVPNGGQPQQQGASPNAAAPNAAAPNGQRRFDNNDDFDFFCMSDRDTRNALEDYGFERVRVTRHLRNNRVEVTAYWGRNQYSMRVDQCTGEVDRVRRIRRGFGLDFNFSN